MSIIKDVLNLNTASDSTRQWNSLCRRREKVCDLFVFVRHDLFPVYCTVVPINLHHGALQRGSHYQFFYNLHKCGLTSKRYNILFIYWTSKIIFGKDFLTSYCSITIIASATPSVVLEIYNTLLLFCNLFRNWKQSNRFSCFSVHLNMLYLERTCKVKKM